jgi:origin recognition complex subunit 6
VDLACDALRVPLDGALAARCSGAAPGAYRAARATLVKALGVARGAGGGGPRELCAAAGAPTLADEVRAALDAFRERAAAALPPAARAGADFGRPAFLAAALLLVARRRRAPLDRRRLLAPLGVTGAELARAAAAMAAALPERFGAEEGGGGGAERKAKKAAKEAAAADGAGEAEPRDDDGAAAAEEEEEGAGSSDGGGEAGARKRRAGGGGAAKAKRPKLTERQLRAAVLGCAENAAPRGNF